jgi:membrane-bound lytic murein transglycosylase B
MPLDSVRRRLFAGLGAGSLLTLSATPLAWLPAHALAASAKRSPKKTATFAGHPAARAFAAEVAPRRGLSQAWVERALARARPLATVQKLIMPPPVGTPKNWAAYRARFVESRRIQAGLAFWRANEAGLQQAEQASGVPAAIIVAIVGVETFYGRITGNFRVIDALATLSFAFPSGRSDRSAFFRTELEEFLVFAQREGLDPLQPKGSFAGAIGLPQFMPGSINRFAVDGDGNGHIDLWTNGTDVAASVGNFLARHGWQRGLPTHHGVAVPVDTSARARLLEPDILPTFSAAQMAELGAELDAGGRAHTGLLALVELQNGDLAPSYVAGTENFYALTRYNWSAYYAMAVIDLAAALQRGR